MAALASGLRAVRTQPHFGDATAEDHEASLARSLRAALEAYLNGRKLVRVKIRETQGKSVEGFLKIEGGKGERLLVDFKATETLQGGFSSLEVGGRKVSLAPDPASKRTHREGRELRNQNGWGTGKARGRSRQGER